MRILKGKISQILVVTMLLAAAPMVPTAAADLAQNSVSDDLTEAVADTLKPGEFRWQPERAAEGSLTVIVSISRQMAYIYRSGALIGISTVSTGKPGYETPIGTFPILQKEVYHRSTTYESAPMPFMQRLTWDGLALHAGQIPGVPASHGCVRLPVALARLLYRETKIGMIVTILDEDQDVAAYSE